MIKFNRFQLENGLRVIHHEDVSTPFAVVNVTYDVGAKDEHPERTGFAHLFEHLMFGGSENAPNFDRPLELAGATNNAFTNNDLTNYYEIIPSENIETAFWLESDRMNFLTINQKSLDVQKKVVVEEFKERYLNQPYGETWHYLREMAYHHHPYRWPTIGLNTNHISDASLEDVQNFYDRFYQPNNAVLTVTGHISLEKTKKFTDKWFGNIPAGPSYHRQFLPEPRQEEMRRKEIELEVPFDSIHIAFPMPAKGEKNYYECDLISDVLSNGDSSRLNQALVKKQNLFTSINAYITGSFENGLFVISGKPSNGISRKSAEQAIWSEIEQLLIQPPTKEEFQKVKNKVEASLTYQKIEIMNIALSLAMAEILGDVNEVNNENRRYQSVTLPSFLTAAQELFRKENSNTLWQIAKQV